MKDADPVAIATIVALRDWAAALAARAAASEPKLPPRTTSPYADAEGWTAP